MSKELTHKDAGVQLGRTEDNAIARHYITGGANNDIPVYDSSNAKLVGKTPAEILTILSGGGGWWHEYLIAAVSISPGASGAAFVDPSSVSLGGYNLDGDSEHLDFQAHIEDDWDGASDPIVEIWFEKDIAGGSSGDDAILKLDCYYKGTGEVTNKTQSLTATVEVDDDARYTLYMATFTINWDLVSHVVEVDDVFGFHLWFDATNSDTTDICVNFIEFKYKTAKPALEA